MDKFTEAEINNRVKALEAIKSILKPGWELRETPPEDKVRWDFELIKNNKKIIIEHKDRTYKSDSFEDWMISGDKYNFLINLPFKVYYINTFKDGKYAIWDLKKCPKVTRESTHWNKTVVDSKLVTKQEVFLRIKNAIKYGTY